MLAGFYGMRLPNRMLHFVCFLHGPTDERGKPIWLGTGFFVSVEEEGQRHTYLVTARHVVEAARLSLFPLYARINETWLPDTKAKPIELALSKFVYAPLASARCSPPTQVRPLTSILQNQVKRTTRTRYKVATHFVAGRPACVPELSL